MKSPRSVLPKALRPGGKRPLQPVVARRRPMRIHLSKKHIAFKQRTWAQRERRVARQARRNLGR